MRAAGSGAWRLLAGVALLAGGTCAAQTLDPATTPETAPAVEPALVPESGADAAVDAGRVLFERAAAAIEKARALTFRARTYATGKLAGFSTATTQADVRMVRNPRYIAPADGTAAAGLRGGVGGPSAWLLRATGATVMRAGDAESAFDVAWLHDSVEWTDHAARKVLERRPNETKGVRGSALQPATSMRPEEVMGADPFGAELAGESFEVLPREVIGGVECDVVEVMLAKGRSRVRWALGVEDGLPRRREGIITTAIAEGTRVLELTNVEADASDPPRLTEANIRLPVPEGYTEDRAGLMPVAPVPTPGLAGTTAPGTDENPFAHEDGDAPAAAVPASEDRSPREDGQPDRAGVLAPDFDLATPAGERVTLASLRGSVVVLEFSGSWCLPTREAHPELQVLTDGFKDRPVRVFQLAVRERTPAAVTEAHRQGGHAFGLLLGADGAARAYGVRVYPTYIVIDGAGAIVATESGYAPEATMKAIAAAVGRALGIPAIDEATPPSAPE